MLILSLVGRYAELLLSSQHDIHSRRRRRRKKNNAITSQQGSPVLGIRIAGDRMGNTVCKRRRAEKQPTVPPGAAHAAEHSDVHRVST